MQKKTDHSEMANEDAWINDTSAETEEECEIYNNLTLGAQVQRTWPTHKRNNNNGYTFSSEQHYSYRILKQAWTIDRVSE